jgi:hypothetical protein
MDALTRRKSLRLLTALGFGSAASTAVLSACGKQPGPTASAVPPMELERM